MPLTLDNLKVSIGSFDLNIKNLTVEKGHFCVVLGRSGSGKSTLFNAIAGFIPLISGTVRMDGIELQCLPPEKRRVALVFQRSSLFPHLTLYKNVEFGLRVQGKNATERKPLVQKWMQKLQILDLSERYPEQVSGGQAQRAVLARSLITGYPLLLMDEPFVGLDLELKQQFFPLLKNLVKEANLCTLLVTHDPLEAAYLADQIVTIDNGRLVEMGGPELFRKKTQNSLRALLRLDPIS